MVDMIARQMNAWLFLLHREFITLLPLTKLQFISVAKSSHTLVSLRALSLSLTHYLIHQRPSGLFFSPRVMVVWWRRRWRLCVTRPQNKSMVEMWWCWLSGSSARIQSQKYSYRITSCYVAIIQVSVIFYFHIFSSLFCSRLVYPRLPLVKIFASIPLVFCYSLVTFVILLLLLLLLLLFSFSQLNVHVKMCFHIVCSWFLAAACYFCNGGREPFRGFPLSFRFPHFFHFSLSGLFSRPTNIGWLSFNTHSDILMY